MNAKTDKYFSEVVALLREPMLSQEEVKNLRQGAAERMVSTLPSWDQLQVKKPSLLNRLVSFFTPTKSAMSAEEIKSKTYSQTVSEFAGEESMVDGMQTYELAHERQHDLLKMLKCCKSELVKYRATGDIPAPFYFWRVAVLLSNWRVAVLLSKAKRYGDEVELLEAFKPYASIGIGQRYRDLIERLPKAHTRLAKSRK